MSSADVNKTLYILLLYLIFTKIKCPIATSGWLVEKTGITPATVNKALRHLELLGIVKEITAQKRNRLFSYAGYIKIMGRGTELPGE